ncbi:hypothetical protein [Pseudogemmobacter sp. W21_MBD1_M6]|uniref:hypothetical protein n=1 Tax=Pseudogemmobacter sp. W21_MBD1_M6 TaxID=3240271 RepID=UPI003F9DBC6F
MSLDPITDAISHFIGLFETLLEQARLRIDYNELKALQQVQTEFSEVPFIDVETRETYAVEGFDPKPVPAPTEPTTSVVEQTVPVAKILPNTIPVSLTIAGNAYSSGVDGFPTHFTYNALDALNFTIEPAGSVVAISVQQAFLSDNDVLRTGDGDFAFLATDGFEQRLDALTGLAAAAQVITSPDMPATEADIATYPAHAFAQIQTAQLLDIGGPHATLVLGPDTLGVWVNSKTVDEAPQVKDHLPASLAPSAPEDAEDAEDETAPSSPPAHDVLTGSNLLVNEAVIQTNWLDAEVIAVAGSAVTLDLISQINVLSDIDHLNGVASGPQPDLSPDLWNVASFSAKSSAPDGQSDDPEAATGTLPSNWIVTRIDGNVINLSWVQQYTFALDQDIGQIAFSAEATLLQFGENTIVNASFMQELGYHYDLIMVGGNLIDFNSIIQTNVLLDDDWISYSGVAPDGLSGDGNLLWNGASIFHLGVDTYDELSAPFSDGLDQLAAGGTTIGQDIAQDTLFDGTEALRVLYISGDMISARVIEQTNILGDADQVALAMESLAAQTDAPVTVMTGENALANLATINDMGVDSVILTADGHYSDALLYQAEFIDPDAGGAGGTAALANEAVAFLADDLILSDDPYGDGSIYSDSYQNCDSSPDVMQSVLA